MNRHGIASLSGKMAAQMRRGRRVATMRPSNPPAEAGSTLPLWGFLFYEWNSADPNDFSTTTLQGNPFQKGLNWGKWDDFLRARIAARGGIYANEVVNGDANSGTFVPGAGNWIMLKGLANIDMGSALNICVLGNSPPRQHIRAIKAASKVNTEVHTGLHNFQSVNQQAYSTYTALEPARLVSRGFPLAGAATSGCSSNTLNRYGCTAIDEYEGNATGVLSWPTCGPDAASWTNIVGCPHDAGRHAGLPANAPNFTKHVWECDVTSSAHRTALAAEWVNYCNSQYNGTYNWEIDGMLIDNMRQDVYTGDATNASPLPTQLAQVAYRQGWRDMQAAWAAALASSGRAKDGGRFRWANCTDLTGAYDQNALRNRWVELFFVNTSGSGPRPWAGANGILEGLQRAKAEGLRIVLGLTDLQSGTFAQQFYWASTDGGQTPGTNGTWAQIYSTLDGLDYFENVYAQAVRQTTAGGWAFWQQGWRPIGT